MGSVGILALQGCVDPHREHLSKLGVASKLVKLPQDFESIEGLILPGGESTTMIRLAKAFGLWDVLAKESKRIPFWGVCAGSILMAKEVEGPKQESLMIMDFTAERNSYGRQLDSFEGMVQLSQRFEGHTHPALFIRAPRFSKLSSGVSVEGSNGDDAVFLEQGLHMVTACHPELTNDSWFHEYFVGKIRSLQSV
jgi:pyridoxal 5'-phosphate synthase pdxT subunit